MAESFKFRLCFQFKVVWTQFLELQFSSLEVLDYFSFKFRIDYFSLINFFQVLYKIRLSAA